MPIPRLSKLGHILISGLFVLSMTLQGIQPAAAQDSGTVRIQHHPQTGKVSFIGAEPGHPIRVPAAQVPGMAASDRALSMVEAYAADFGLKQPNRELKVSKSETAKGRQITKFQQVYQGIPVMAGELVVNADNQGGLLSINGEISPDLGVDTSPAITAQKAEQAALGSMLAWKRGAAPEDFKATQPELWIYDARLLQPDGTPPSLVWRMDVTSRDASAPLRELVLVDAHSGRVLLHFNQLDGTLTSKTSPAPSAPAADLAAAGTWPVYFELALDETRAWIYGSDSAGNKVDVISTSTLQLVKSFTLVNGSAPKGLALSPDGSELAIAQSGASSILFLNPDTGAVIASVTPSVDLGANRPWDIVYGRPGRLYSLGNSGGGWDNLHVIDTVTHSEVAKSATSVYGSQRLAISADKNSLYLVEFNDLYKFNITTDSIPGPISYASDPFTGTTFILDTVDNLFFTDTGEVWTGDTRYKLGLTGFTGQVAYVPNHNAVAIATATGVVFASTADFYTLSTVAMTIPGAAPIIAMSDGSKVFVNTASGIVVVDCSSFPPGTPGSYPSGHLPYTDLVVDEAHGVLYGSDTVGHKVDVISMSTLQVVSQVRLKNGTRPMGMDLSPDGSELAVAVDRGSGIYFMDTSTRTVKATAFVYGMSSDMPYDVVYGRAGRAYSTGNPGSGGFDYIHVIDTATHTEIARSSFIIRADPRLQITSDGHTLYSNEDFSPNELYKFDVSTDTIPNPVRAPFSAVSASDFILLSDGSKIFTNMGQVWPSSLAGNLGSFSPRGELVEAPSLDAVAVISTSTPGLISFVSRVNYYTIGSVTIPGVTTAGPGAVSSDNKLFVSTDAGVKMVMASLTAPNGLAVYDGSGQMAKLNSTFTNPLKAKAVNLFGNPLSGVSVIFTAPGTGASGKFSNASNTITAVTDANGIANAGTLTANGTAGGFAVQATVAGAAASASFSLTNLVFTLSNGAVQTYTMNHSYDGNLLPGTFVCDLSNNNCTNGSDADADHAEQFALDTYVYYQSHLNRNSVDNAGLPLISSVHFGSGYPNAFWDGAQMVYGDGYSAGLDVVGHELTHGVTQYTSNLFYYYQSGAINESMSDVFGELIQRSYNGTGDSWLIGEDLPGGAIRSMSNPPAYGDPDKMSSPYYNLSEADNGGVHSNSGINNKAAYLMVDGGYFNGKTVAAIGADKTAAIYYEVETHLLTSGSDYGDLYVDLYQACLNQVGGAAGVTLTDCQSVQDAVDAVEMNGQPIANYNTDAPTCAAGNSPVALFSDGFENGTGNWTFSSTNAPRWQVDSAYFGPNAHSGQHSLYADDYPDEVTDASATMNWGVTLPPNAYLHFAQAYDFEHYVGNANWYDGGVLEYSANGGAWTDAGSLMDFNGYGGVIAGGYGNPLAGRQGFVGVSHGYISTRLNLAALAGQNVRFRWRMGLDGLGYSLGWWLDDVQIYTCAPFTGHTISGNAGVGGALLSYHDGTDKTVTADGSGNYSLPVSAGWSGTVIPSKPGYWFDPPGRSYSALTVDRMGQQYTASNAWAGSVSITADRNVVAVGRPHVGSQVMTYDSFAAGSTTSYLPMLFKNAFGGSYDSAFYVQNVDASHDAHVTVKYYDTNGSLTCTKPVDTIPPLSSHGIWVPAESNTCLPVGWVGGAVVTSSDFPIVAVARPHVGSEVMTYDGFASGSTTSYLPMLFKNAWGSYDSAFYVQNVDSTNPAHVTVKYYDTFGTLTCTKPVDTIPPLSSHGIWVPAEAADCLPVGWVGGAVVSSSDSPIVAVARPHIGSSVTAYNGFASGNLGSYLPMLFKNAFGGSYDSAFYVQNLDSTHDAHVTVKYYDSNGTLTCTKPVDSIPPMSSHGIWVPAENNSCLPVGWVGAAVVTSSDYPIVAVGRPHVGSEVTAYGGFTAGGLAINVPMLFKNIWGSYNSALYIQNTEAGGPASVTLKFYDVNGNLSCQRTDSIPALATLGYWVPSVMCQP